MYSNGETVAAAATEQFQRRWQLEMTKSSALAPIERDCYGAAVLGLQGGQMHGHSQRVVRRFTNSHSIIIFFKTYETTIKSL